MATKEELTLSVKTAQAALDAAKSALEAFESSPENHAYDSLDRAKEELYDYLRDKACEDCEGSYNCGSDEYEQEFSVSGERYLATLEVEYNRHDKTYYYVEEATLKVEKL